jgi:hypothetical protein
MAMDGVVIVVWSGSVRLACAWKKVAAGRTRVLQVGIYETVDLICSHPYRRNSRHV